MLKTLTLLTASILAVTSFNAAANCDPGEIVIKFSHVTNTDKHPKGIAASLLEERVNKEMNGKACLQVFPNSTLYDDDKVLEAMLNGDVQLAAPSLSKFEKFTKKFRIFDLPFLFEDVDAVDRFQNSADGEKLKNSMTRRGVKGLEFWHNGMKQMSANKPLLVPADAKGLKFRVQASDVLVAQLSSLVQTRKKCLLQKCMAVCKLKLLMVKKIHGPTFTVRNSLKCKMALPKPITAFWTT
ncbi:C4-dicarboxylate-binding protein [Vibrio anguillarum 775]|nr:C4-dicarboxylate-binding protein [Vibrio anguillarum 775]